MPSVIMEGGMAGEEEAFIKTGIPVGFMAGPTTIRHTFSEGVQVRSAGI